MPYLTLIFDFLIVIILANGECRLVIFKNNEDVPVASNLAVTKGINLTLTCRYVGPNNLELNKVAWLTPINKNRINLTEPAKLNFAPVQLHDGGVYFCIVAKHKLRKRLNLIVKSKHGDVYRRKRAQIDLGNYPYGPKPQTDTSDINLPSSLQELLDDFKKRGSIISDNSQDHKPSYNWNYPKPQMDTSEINLPRTLQETLDDLKKQVSSISDNSQEHKPLYNWNYPKPNTDTSDLNLQDSLQDILDDIKKKTNLYNINQGHESSNNRNPFTNLNDNDSKPRTVVPPLNISKYMQDLLDDFEKNNHYNTWKNYDTSNIQSNNRDPIDYVHESSHDSHHGNSYNNYYPKYEDSHTTTTKAKTKNKTNAILYVIAAMVGIIFLIILMGFATKNTINRRAALQRAANSTRNNGYNADPSSGSLLGTRIPSAPMHIPPDIRGETDTIILTSLILPSAPISTSVEQDSPLPPSYDTSTKNSEIDGAPPSYEQAVANAEPDYRSTQEAPLASSNV